MRRPAKRALYAAFLAGLLLLAGGTPQLLRWASFPSAIWTGEGSRLTLLAPLEGRIDAGVPGRYTARLPLLPWFQAASRPVTVHVMPPVEVVPGGESVGVMLRARGAVVQSLASAADSPARAAGLRPGDVLLAADGRRLEGIDALVQAVQAAGRSGRPLRLQVQRGPAVLTLEARPRKIDGQYRLGVWVRDSAAGVGTVTFYDPATRTVAALGHRVSDEHGDPYPMRDGKFVTALVSGVQPSRQGQPGEKVGVFLNVQHPLATIRANTAFGVFGRLAGRPPAKPAVPVAWEDQVHPGPAEMITVVQGLRPEAFRVEIERVIHSDQPSARSFILRVTDPRLLHATGGIVQGMSGSPVLQDGRLVGAVTHVFIHDPTRGYGVFAQWMLEQGGLLQGGAERSMAS
ncbi:MAG: SpoIVB peptidase [Clostridia bacterium]|nr:SpoIVB peptidase [Clostridia bacterium]